MKRRICRWACGGVFVASCWVLFSLAIPVTSASPILLSLALLSQPAVLIGFYFHFGLHFYWVILANAATYALIGLLLETARPRKIAEAE